MLKAPFFLKIFKYWIIGPANQSTNCFLLEYNGRNTFFQKSC